MSRGFAFTSTDIAATLRPVNILITGANRGIGLALTGALLKRGHRVLATRREQSDAAELEALVAAHRAQSPRVLPLDVTSEESVKKLAELVRADAGVVDVLVNNAGVLPEPSDANLDALKRSDFDDAFNTNVTGPMLMCREFVPLMRDSSRPSIVNIGSGAGSIAERPGHLYYAYGASKAALHHFTRGLADELGPSGFTVVAISPGWVRTDMGGPDAELSPVEVAESLAETILQLTHENNGRFLDRHGRPDRYAW